jgi:chlorobactene glucosyltransferase
MGDIMVNGSLVAWGYSLGILGTSFLNTRFFVKPSLAVPQRYPKVSVLIPARNEAANLEKNLPLWQAVAYPNLEIWVLNDQSEDSTQKVLNQHAKTVRSANGKPLAQGWLGKNWACHQLSQLAGGDILIFVDADVSPNSSAVTQTVATLETSCLDACSIFLQQNYTYGLSESILPWVLQFGFLAWPPHFLRILGRFRSLAVGNGQWFAFKRESYKTLGGHEKVRDRIVEDIALAQSLFDSEMRYAPVLGPQIGSVTMYRNWRELREGLSKNLALIYGPQLGLNLIFLGLYLGVLGVCFYDFGLPLVPIVLAWRLIQDSFHQKKKGPKTWIPGFFLSLYLFGRSILFLRIRKVEWKGRSVATGF